jgi:hypothetical protein
VLGRIVAHGLGQPAWPSGQSGPAGPLGVAQHARARRGHHAAGASGRRGGAEEIVDIGSSSVDPGSGNEFLRQGGLNRGYSVARWSKGGGTVELIEEAESSGDQFRKRGGSWQLQRVTTARGVKEGVRCGRVEQRGRHGGVNQRGGKRRRPVQEKRGILAAEMSSCGKGG